MSTDSESGSDSTASTDAEAGGDMTASIDAEAGRDITASTDAGLESDRSAPTDAAPDCAHRQPPGPPNVIGQGGTLDLVLPMYSAEYGWLSYDDAGNPRYQSIGFDLDNTCTGEGQGPSCQEPAWATASHHDGVDGIDNAAGQTAWQVASLDNITQTVNGVNSVIRVRRYSGGTDDDQVEVSFYYSAGLTPRADGGVDLLWDGTDRWSASPDSLVQPAEGGTPSVDQPLYVDEHAYVSGGVLVARLQDGLLPAFFTGVPVHVHNLVIAGSLVHDPNGLWRLTNATIDQRYELKTLLYGTAWAPYGSGQNCQYPSAYADQVMRYCAVADVAFNSDSPTAPCDAVSFAFGFEARQGLLGGLMGFTAAPLTCDPSVNPNLVTCDHFQSD